MLVRMPCIALGNSRILNAVIVFQMQELTGAVIQVEEELKGCLQEIELLKLSTPL